MSCLIPIFVYCDSVNRYVLDAWYRDSLHQAIDGPAELKKLLSDRDIGLDELAQKIHLGRRLLLYL